MRRILTEELGRPQMGSMIKRVIGAIAQRLNKSGRPQMSLDIKAIGAIETALINRGSPQIIDRLMMIGAIAGIRSGTQMIAWTAAGGPIKTLIREIAGDQST